MINKDHPSLFKVFFLLNINSHMILYWIDSFLLYFFGITRDFSSMKKFLMSAGFLMTEISDHFVNLYVNIAFEVFIYFLSLYECLSQISDGWKG